MINDQDKATSAATKTMLRALGNLDLPPPLYGVVLARMLAVFSTRLVAQLEENTKENARQLVTCIALDAIEEIDSVFDVYVASREARNAIKH